MRSICREIIVAFALTGLLAATPAAARETVDYTNELAIAIAAAPDPDAVAAAVATYEIGYGLGPEQVAQAFGEATSLCDLGRCANPNAVVAAFANYKQGKDVAVLDAAFAAGARRHGNRRGHGEWRSLSGFVRGAGLPGRSAERSMMVFRSSQFRRRIALGLFALLVNATPALAADPATGDGADVLTRARPEYDARGVHVGTFFLYPSLTGGLGYSDNVFNSQADLDDYFYALSPQIRLASDWARHALNLSAEATSHWYDAQSGENRTDWNVGANGRLDIVRGSEIKAEVHHIELHEPRGTDQTGGLCRGRSGGTDRAFPHRHRRRDRSHDQPPAPVVRRRALNKSTTRTRRA